MPVNTPEDILNYLGVDLQARGPYGVKSDISINASTFQQVLILVNGVPVKDTPLAAVEAACRLAAFRQGDRLLEIGVGSGRFLAYAVRRFPVAAEGWELSLPMVLFARLRLLSTLWRAQDGSQLLHYGADRSVGCRIPCEP